MKIFKLLLVSLLIVTLTIPFVACSDSGDQPGTTDEDSKRTITMGTNAAFPPFEFEDGGEIKGIDADFAKAIAEELGYELKIENLEFDVLITALNTNKVDFIAAGMTITPLREEQVNFSDTYYTAQQAVVVLEDSTISTLDDLVGKKIGVQAGTTGQYLAEEIEGANDNKLINGYNAGAEAIQALLNGQIDAVVVDNLPATEFFNKNEGLKLLNGLYEDEEYAIAFRKSDTTLLNDFNNAMKKLINDGSFQEIVDKYMLEK